MAIPGAFPVRFTPRGLTDAYDATDVFPGACRKLQNLVFDESNPEIVISRPGVGPGITDFDGFITPGYVSAHIVIGDYIFGMLATGLTAGKDEPFCYRISTESFIAITGVDAGNAEGRPTSPATTGAWTPPTMAVIGVKIIITHPGYSGSGSNFFGVVDISNLAAPAYSTANTSTNALPSVPTSVANLNNRAWYACGNENYFSDVLAPLVMTNAGQAVTLGDSSPIVAQSGLPIQTSSAGVISGLLVFKKNSIWQIIGDEVSTTSPLALSFLSLTLGTSMPRSVVSTPFGVVFGGPDGAYVVSPLGAVMPLTHDLGQGSLQDLRQPFIYCTQPTRVAAAFAANIYRVCIPTVIDGVAGTFDYWFNSRKMRWTGPHTFAYECASSAGGHFILSASAKLFSSQAYPVGSSVYDDNGATYTATLQPAKFPKVSGIQMHQLVESTIELASSGEKLLCNIQAHNDLAGVMGDVNIVTDAAGVTLWGASTWGGGIWCAAVNEIRTYFIPWKAPLVFKKIYYVISGMAKSNFNIGTLMSMFQPLGYSMQELPNSYPPAVLINTNCPGLASSGIGGLAVAGCMTAGKALEDF